MHNSVAIIKVIYWYISADNIILMQKTIPVLNPEQIQQLNSMVHGILSQNKKKLDDILSQVVRIQNTTILNLYKLVVEEWTKKQKIIDNLCHFSLTMMSSVHLLWDQKEDYSQRLKSAQLLIDSLQKHLEDLNDENEKYKTRIHEAETQIESINGQRDRFQELYKSQSCLHSTDRVLPSDMHNSKDGLDCGHKSLMQQQRDQLIQQTSKCLLQKQSQIIELREQKKQLQRKFQQLMQQHKLARMQVQLADIAVSDALSYRQSSLANRSQIMNRSDEIYTTKSHAQFMNGQLECFSNPNQSFHEQNQFLPNQLTNQNMASSPQLEESSTVNPFKKKSLKKHQKKYYTQADQIQSSVCLKSSVRDSEIKAGKDKKTVSIQCNLLKNVPKIRLFPKKTSEIVEKRPQIKQVNIVSKQSRKLINSQTESVKTISKSEIIKAADEVKGQSSIGRFFNFISSKVITNRIKIK